MLALSCFMITDFCDSEQQCQDLRFNVKCRVKSCSSVCFALVLNYSVCYQQIPVKITNDVYQGSLIIVRLLFVLLLIAKNTCV